MNTLVNGLSRRRVPLFFFVLLFAFFGCDGGYLYIEKSPSWMGGSLYATLQKDGRFTNYLKMLQQMDSSYIEVLQRTGSRTLFVPTDEAFASFYANNPNGIKRVEDMSKVSIKGFLEFYTLENAYVTSNLGSSLGPVPGGCLRRYTTLVTSDSIPYTDNFPDNPQFKKFKGKKMYLSTPGNWTLINFTQNYFNRNKISNEDFNLLYPGANRQSGDVHVFGAKIIDGDIVSSNGYIHVLDKVELPPVSMYEYIRDNENLSVFRKLIERFCEPVYNKELTDILHERHPEALKDSVYDISFFDTASRMLTDVNGNQTSVDAILFSPAENGIPNNIIVGGPPADMPVVIVPTDDAMNQYFNSSFLKEYAGNGKTWENLPNDIAVKFVKTQMKRSFQNTLPTNIENFVDDVKGDNMGLTKADLKDVKVCRNGAVYIIDKVSSPRDFSTVVAPLFNNPQTKIFNWIINESYNNKALKFNYYLTSLENRFTLFVPVDESFLDYVDPVWQSSLYLIKRKLKFTYNPKLKGVNYIICNMDGDSIGFPSTPFYNNPSNPTLVTIQNRLKDIVDYHVVLGDITEDEQYAQTKGGAFIKLTYPDGQMHIQGAGDIENGTSATVLAKFNINNGIKNGTVYIINKRIEHALKSVYQYGIQSTECNEFFTYLSAFDSPDYTFFADSIPLKITPYITAVTKSKETEFIPPIFNVLDGVNYAIPFLGLYNYTLFAPTNGAMQLAHEGGLYLSIDDIKAISDPVKKIVAIKEAISFIKNHFVDQAVFTKQFYHSSQSLDFALPRVFTTSAKTFAKNPATKRFNNVNISQDSDGKLLIKSGNVTARTINDKTDVMLRQYRFLSANISTNSRIVVHQIDNVMPMPIIKE